MGYLFKINNQQTDKIRKKIISIFKNINFKIEIVTNLTEVDFLDVTFNLENNTYRPYKKPNDKLIYTDVSSNHPPQIKKQLTKIISDRLSRNSSNADIFNKTKSEYEEALKKCGHTTKLTYNPPNHEQNNARRKRNRKIIWFNPPFNLDVSTNVAKIFLNLIEKHFPRSSKLHKIFNKNTVKVSYSCTQNMSQIIKGHNKKIIQNEKQGTLDCNCRVKTDCPLNGGCRKESVIYKCTATTCDSKKVYLGLTEGEFKKQRYYDHVKSFKNEFYANSTTLSSCVWELKKRKNVTPALTWEVLRTAKAYSNITKRCSLCLHEKLAIITYPYPDELLNRRSELVMKCRHENKFLLKNFNSND